MSPLGVQVVRYHAGFNGSFVLSAYSVGYAGFVLTGSFKGEDLLGEAFACNLWASLATVELMRSTRPPNSGW